MVLAFGLIQKETGVVTADHTVFALLLIGIVALIYERQGIYHNHGSLGAECWRLLQAWTLSVVILMLIGFFSGHVETFPRLLVVRLWVIGYLAQLIAHVAVWWVLVRLVQPARAERALIVGTSSIALYLREKIQKNPWLNQTVAGFVSPHVSGRSADDMPVLGHLRNLAEIIAEQDIRAVYFALPLQSSELVEAMYRSLLDQPVDVHWVPDIFSLKLLNHSLKEIGGLPVVTLAETPLLGTRRLLKSVEDFVLAALILVLVSPVLLLIALLIKWDSPGPVFYRQTRNGWNGKKFEIWKFRSMYVQLPGVRDVKQARRDDPRVTRVGRILRRTSLDELPQLFNVLGGDMSLVGPRPHAIQHDIEYARRIEDYMARQKIKPGITGLAQVRGLRGETAEIWKMIQRVESDIEYINNWSLILDFGILLKTLKSFSGRNAY